MEKGGRPLWESQVVLMPMSMPVVEAGPTLGKGVSLLNSCPHSGLPVPLLIEILGMTGASMEGSGKGGECCKRRELLDPLGVLI